MTSQMKELEDHMALISQMYSGLCTQVAPQQGETKPRRRQKKGKGGEGGVTAAAKKRKLSDEQVHLLELNFGNEHKLESNVKTGLLRSWGSTLGKWRFGSKIGGAVGRIRSLRRNTAS
ncbi:Homeobox-leucine zipper protein ATHB-40 [Hibiscus syriacus]|uniref:Homeobox-leucine zipper protein ATHB-40 n=1 Tax=Hibiscus syriacus TaxID=106335 RepID=A0A6A3BKS6_HIBSY|nr:Homeobox-leucine zipper protein ATHB-40 [Hibiscus syriacus]